MVLTNRERFNNLFRGEQVDRVPFLDFMGPCNLPSSLERWKTEGLSAGATFSTVRDLIGFDGMRGYYLPLKAFVWPEFNRETISKNGDKVYIRNHWGGIEVNSEKSELMPITISGAVHDRESWKPVRERLMLQHEGRFPANWDVMCLEAEQSQEPVYAGDLPIGFFGGPRELLGFEPLAYLFYDDPELLNDILDTLCDLWIELFATVQSKIKLDYFFIWEDMCFKNGPLISPQLFREFLVPRYRRLTKSLRERGCRQVMVDSDGDERQLVPAWIDGGVSIVFPWETQFGLDITEVRRQYPNLGMVGGMNKHALADGRDAIDKELLKVPFMLESGRFIPCLDHGVTSEVSWDSYQYFYDRLRELIWKYPPAY